MPYTAFDQLREANPVPDPKARHAREADLAALADSVLRDAHNQDVDSVVLKPHARRSRWGRGGCRLRRRCSIRTRLDPHQCSPDQSRRLPTLCHP